MNPTSKKFVSLFLVLSLMMLPTSLYAKKRGAKLLITKKDGQQVEGELITVKEDSLLLLNTTGKDMAVDIADIRIIRILKKSKVLQGLGFGLLIGAGFSALYALSTDVDPCGSIATEGEVLQIIWWGAVFVPIGLLIGGIVGFASGIDKTIQIEGKSDLGIRYAMDKLRKKARVRDYR